MLDSHAAWQALRARDARFDGLLYVGVTSTGIYCRPICPARTPRVENCRFFASAAAAEKARFRPCLRCRPELAPGLAPVDDGKRIATLLARRIEQGLAEEGSDLETIAQQFQLSSRQLRRIVQRELGVSPIELLQTRRLLLAKQLLTETRLPVTEIAFASGFSSLRRFNDAFRTRYQLAPSKLRRAAAHDPGARFVADETSRLLLAYRPPYDWNALLEFLAARSLAGVEAVEDGVYRRTVRLGTHTGWVAVRNVAKRNALSVEFTHSLTPVLPALLGRLRQLFDLEARPDVIAAHLGQDPLLKKDASRAPGLRVPGAFDGFELAMRAILGQQITVAAATRLGGRVVEALDEPIVTPFPSLTRLSPLPRVVREAGEEKLGRLGVIRSRGRAIVSIATAIDEGTLSLEPGSPPDTTIAALVKLPGIGPWTAHYIAMRALRWPDAFPPKDVALMSRLGLTSAIEAERRAERWRPWRSYAVMHLWRRPKINAPRDRISATA